MSLPRPTSALALLLCCGVAASAFVVTRLVSMRADSAMPPVTTGSLPSGDSWLLVYVGASSCAGSQSPRLKESLQNAIVRLQAVSEVDARLRTLGVAIDADVGDGLTYLSNVGSFDQVSVGGSWGNLAVAQYIWGIDGTAAAIPQLILVRQQWQADSSSMRVVSEQVAHRLIGPRDIQVWADSVVRERRALAPSPLQPAGPG